MADIDRLIGFMAIMQVPFMNDPDALAYIEEVKTVLKQAKAQEPGWISIKNRQPTKSDEYLVVITYGDNYSIGIASFVNFPGDGFWRIGKDSVLLPDFMKITHWMPLPDAPKGVSQA